jgi:hypothetical protein
MQEMSDMFAKMMQMQQNQVSHMSVAPSALYETSLIDDVRRAAQHKRQHQKSTPTKQIGTDVAERFDSNLISRQLLYDAVKDTRPGDHQDFDLDCSLDEPSTLHQLDEATDNMELVVTDTGLDPSTMLYSPTSISPGEFPSNETPRTSGERIHGQQPTYGQAFWYSRRCREVTPYE